MPQAVTIASPGLQALILCGPGSSFPTFTANPDEKPKALIPLGNRPMVWYPLDFCYRAGITGAFRPGSHTKHPPIYLHPIITTPHSSDFRR